MTTPRNADADDLFVDLCLDEQIGGKRPPDLRARLLAADATKLARAAAAVDAASAAASLPEANRLAPRWTTLVACILVAIGALAVWRLVAKPLARDPADRDPAAQAQALLDEFHKVMPREPESLRDPRRRARLAATALPVLRDLAALLREHRTEISFADRADEFLVYAMVLGDASVRRPLAERAAAGDAEASMLLLAAVVIGAEHDHERSNSLAKLGEGLRTAAASAMCAMRCVVTAGDLTEIEALQLAEQTTDAQLERQLRFAAEMAATSPQRLLGQPLELTGRLADGEDFTTASLRGKVVLVCFWATWCQPCLAALPEVLAVHERYAAAGLAVIGVSCDHDRAALSRYLAEHPAISWPQLFDAGRPGWHELAFFCGVRSIPSVFLIDRRGVLRDVSARDDLDMLVRRLLDE
ncbi:MAG: TlpA disulfide reductase family protein [Planctomycetota bacterium]